MNQHHGPEHGTFRMDSFLTWDGASSAPGSAFEFLRTNTSNTAMPAPRKPFGWIFASSNGGHCTVDIVRRHRCRLVIELSTSLGFVPSTASLRASFEPSTGVARRSVLLMPLASCSRMYGVTVPAALAEDLQSVSSGTVQWLVVMRVSLECEGMPGGHKHHNLWGRELVIAALMVEGRNTVQTNSSGSDLDALLRSFWLDRAIKQRKSDTMPPPQPPLPPASTTGAYIQVLPPRTATCGPSATNARSVHELRHAAYAFYERRLQWQQNKLAPAALACVQKAVRPKGDPLLLVFVGDSHMRMLFAQAVGLLGGNVSNHCGNWHTELHNDIFDDKGHAVTGRGRRLLARLSFVWIDGIYENGRHGCRFRGEYSGRTATFPSLPTADFYFVGAPVHWESAFCTEPWQAVVEHTPTYVAWAMREGTPTAPRVWVSANPRGSALECPSCGCRAEGGEGRSNARILRLNGLAWSLAAPHGFKLLDTWAVTADAFEDEADSYDHVHFSRTICESTSKRAYTIVGVLDAIRALAALQLVCSGPSGLN